MGLELGRALLLSDAVSPDAMAQALLAAVRDRVCLARALLTTEAIEPERLEEELARTAPDAPLQQHPAAVLDLVERLPPRLCESLLALPVRRDPLTGTVDVALADAADTHAADEISFYLDAPVRVVRAPLGAIEAAIVLARRQSSYPPGSGPISVPPPSPVRPMEHTPPWGTPIVMVGLDGVDDGTSATLSERAIPLVPKSPSEKAPSAGEIPIPLSRRVSSSMSPAAQPAATPGAGLVALARAAQALEDEEEPVVELRRTKSSVPAMAAVEVEAHRPAAVSVPSAAPQDNYDKYPTLPATPLNQLLREMGRATARDPLMELVLLAIRPVAYKTALFAVKKDCYAGFLCSPEFGDRAQLSTVRIDIHAPSLLSTLATVGTYMGPLLKNEAHTQLFKFIKSQRPEVIGAAIKAAGKPAVLVIAHEVPEPVRAMNTLTEVTRVAGESLEKILRAKR
ncbi:MAG TPA: hypothetical protein VGI39_17775 [Polyangiaceae bacterium]|jgi:hypothetical protein